VTTEREITCIVCPIGCKILIKSDGDKVEVLSGHKCKQGVGYAINEALDPRRMITTSILVEGGEWPLVSVKSSKLVPKDKIFIVLEEIRKRNIPAPVKSGQVVIKNVVGMGLDVVATKTVNKN
jgi:CxxC motif-containing protein